MCEVLTIGEPMVMFLADTKQPLSQVDHFTKMIAGAELNVARKSWVDNLKTD